jgi:hypothetical protein
VAAECGCGMWLQNNVEILTLFKKRIVEFSLKYAASSSSNCCVLKILYECLMMMIQHESKQVAISNDIFPEIELRLTGAVYLYFAST